MSNSSRDHAPSTSAATEKEPLPPTRFLSANFSLAEMEISPLREFDNTVPRDTMATLAATAGRMEQVRAMLADSPVIITSAYRCRALNRAVGGARTSAHLTGHAVDFICPSFGDPPKVIRRLANRPHLLLFDQLIEEGTWVHISFDPRLRQQVLTRRSGGGYGLGLPDDAREHSSPRQVVQPIRGEPK